MNLKIKIATIVLLITQLATQSVYGQLCNGFAELCNKKYNDIVYAEAHNAISHKASIENKQLTGLEKLVTSIIGAKTIDKLSNPGANQNWTIQQQLNAGVRNFEFHLHFDYANPISFYSQLLKGIVDSLQSKLNASIAATQSSHANDFKNIANAQAKVDQLQNSLASINKTIKDRDTWFNKLPNFSFKGDSKTIEGVGYGKDQAASEIERGVIIASIATATGVLNAAKTVLQKLLEADPTIIPLRAQLAIAQQAYNLAGSGAPAAGKQFFVCHGLVKGDLYSAIPQDPNTLFDKMIEDASPNFKAFLTLSSINTPAITINSMTIPAAKVTNPKDMLRNLFTSEVGPLLKQAQSIITRSYGQTTNETDTSGILPYTPCLTDFTREPLAQLLSDIKVWLDTHPTDVITLRINDFVLDNTSLVPIFNASGVLKYSYLQDQSKLWPTLGELIKTNKRLILFKNSPIEGMMNNKGFFFPVSSEFGYKAVTNITQESPTSIDAIVQPTPDNLNAIAQLNEDPKNKLFDFTHNITIGIAGSPEAAAQVNAKSVLLPRLIKIAKALNHAPNVVTLDFLDLPNGEALDAINEFNGVGKYAGKPAWTPTQTTLATAAPKK